MAALESPQAALGQPIEEVVTATPGLDAQRRIEEAVLTARNLEDAKNNLHDQIEQVIDAKAQYTSLDRETVAEEYAVDQVSVVDTTEIDLLDEPVDAVEVEGGETGGEGITEEQAIAHFDTVHEVIAQRESIVSSVRDTVGNLQVQNLSEGVLGQAPIDSSETQATLDASHVAHDSLREVVGTGIHEVGHTGAVQLQTSADAEVVLFNQYDVTADSAIELEEGRVEDKVITETGFDRSNRPQEVYQTGLHFVQDVKSEYAKEFHQTLTVSGDVEGLQNTIWEDGVESGRLDADKIEEQAEQTGYEVSEEVLVELEKNGEVLPKEVRAAEFNAATSL